jgi:hypothetical protein
MFIVKDIKHPVSNGVTQTSRAIVTLSSSSLPGKPGNIYRYSIPLTDKYTLEMARELELGSVLKFSSIEELCKATDQVVIVSNGYNWLYDKKYAETIKKMDKPTVQPSNDVPF